MKDLAEAAGCFADAQGGTVVVGVRHRPGGPDALLGTDLGADHVLRRIYELTSPSLTVSSEEARISGKRLLVLRVPRTPRPYPQDDADAMLVLSRC